MPVLEITQAGINSISAFDPDGNSPTGNFGYCNAYNVDPTTFNKTAFKALITPAQQQAYLASTSVGARDGYATPPIFPYQGNADALVRVGNSGSTVLNQPALRVNKVTADQVKYLQQIASGIGNFYFNLLVVYNTIGTLEANRASSKDMPIAFIYLFDGMQFKTEDNIIEMDTTIQYSGVAATIEYIINPVTTASLLEVSKPDFLPHPTNAGSNIYLIRNPSPLVSSKHPTSIATLSTEDTNYANDLQLWQFDTHNSFIEVLVVSNANNTVFRTNISDFTFALSNVGNMGYIMQVMTGPYVGQCRRIADINSILGYITWETAFGAVITAGTYVRIHIPNKLLLEYPPTPNNDQINYRHSLRALFNHTHGYTYVYDGNGSVMLQTWAPASLLTVTNAVTANWLVSSSKTSIPTGFTGFGILSNYTDSIAGTCRQVLRQLGTTQHTWERNINIGSLTPTLWVLTSENISRINNVSELPTFDPVTLEPVITNYVATRLNVSAPAMGAMDSHANSIIITKSSSSFFWSFSTHSQYVCAGTVVSMDADMGSYREITLDIDFGKTMPNWNLDTTLAGDPNARFIIQFFDDAGTILPLYSGMARGIAVSNVFTGTNKVRLTPSIPTVTSGSVTNIKFVVYECNIAYVNKIQKDFTIIEDYFDNTSSTPSTTNQWGYTDPNGIIHKGGVINVLDSGTTVTYNTPFPNKCLLTTIQPFGAGSTQQIHLEDTTAQEPSFFKAVSDGGNRNSYWYSKGK